ncbi:MAG: oligosaccharide repeat unit polymerase [Acidobacteria bacterium]|nr:oligosaccharide repeat unit polymerase [Acidobacteriota bacterium]
MDVMTGITILIVTGLLIKLTDHEFRQPYHPLKLYLAIWGLGLGLASLPLVDYTPITSAGWIAASLGAIAFSGGILTTSWGCPRQPSDLTIDTQLLSRILVYSTVVGCLGTVLQAMFLERSFGLDVYLTDPVEARRLHTHIPIWGYLDLVNTVNVAAVALYWQKTGRPRLFMWLTLASATASALLTTDRTRFFLMLIWAELVAGSRNPRRRYLRIGIVAVILIGYFSVIGDHYERSYLERFQHIIHLPKPLKILADPYIYYTSSFTAMGQLVDQPSTMLMGKSSFAPIVHVASAVWDIEQAPLVGEFTYVPMEVNTYTYLRQFYADFGWLGIVLGPYLCGLFCGWTEVKRRNNPTVGWSLLAALMGYCCVISTFENLFIQEAIWFLAVICAALGFYEQRRYSRESSIE